MAEYTDNDLMPWGKYKGIKLANVPASYLLWLKKEIEPKAPNKRTLSEKLLLEYILDNEEILNEENKRQ